MCITPKEKTVILMEHYRINGVARRRLQAYAIAAAGVYGYRYGHGTGRDRGVCVGVDLNFFMRWTVSEFSQKIFDCCHAGGETQHT